MEKLRLLWSAAVDGSWLTERRAVRLPAAALVGMTLGLAFAFYPFDDEHGRGLRLGIDFVPFWTAGWLAAAGHAAAIYDFDFFAVFQGEFAGYPGTVHVIFYPPPYIFLVYPLAFIDGYWTALVAWLALTGAAYMGVLWRAWPDWRVLWVGVSAPAVITVLINGQNGFLTAALLGGGVVLAASSPILAGVLLGLATVKPHLGILVPFALIAAGRWTTVATAAAVSLGLAAVAAGVFGIEIWKSYFATAGGAANLLDNNWLPIAKIQSVYAAAVVAGLSPRTGYVLQAAAILAAAAAVIWAWRGDADQRLKTAALLFAAPLAPLYVHDYDLPVVFIGAACLCRYGAERGFGPYEKTLMAALWLLPLCARALATYAHITPTPWLLAAALVLTLRRISQDRALREKPAPIP